MEIYKDEVYDLLVDRDNVSTRSTGKRSMADLGER